MIDFSGMKELTVGGVKLRELSVGGVKVWQAGRLPAGYTELEYIESTGTQYIDTGITGHTGVSVEIDAMIIPPIPSAETGIIGSNNSSSQRCYLTANGATPPLRWNFAAQMYNMEPTTWELDTKYRINIDWASPSSKIYIDGKLHMTLTSSSFDNGMNLYLFARNNKGTVDKMGKARMYYVKMWDGGTLVRDFVPSVRTADGAVGLFDLASGTFFGNAGTGTFTAGGAVG